MYLIRSSLYLIQLNNLRVPCKHCTCNDNVYPKHTDVLYFITKFCYMYVKRCLISIKRRQSDYELEGNAKSRYRVNLRRCPSEDDWLSSSQSHVCKIQIGKCAYVPLVKRMLSFELIKLPCIWLEFQLREA